MTSLKRREFVKLTSASAIFTVFSFQNRKGAFISKNFRVLLYTGWNTKNIGDQGHTPGTLRFLEQHFPEAEITVWIHSTNEEISTMLTNRFPKIRLIQGTIDEKGVADNVELQKAFDTNDLIIHNSGMSYNSFWKSPSILEACNYRKKLMIIFGQSFDGFNDVEREKISGLLSNVKAIYCRDNESYYYLRSIGVNSLIIEFGPDGCFGIDLHNREKAEKYMKEKDLEPKKFITVIIRTNSSHIKAMYIPKKGDIIDKSQNPIEPTEEDIQQNDLWAKKLREVIIYWVKKTGFKVLLAPEVEKEIFYAKELLFNKLPEDIKPFVVHKGEWWNMDEACSVYKHSHTLISMEPHSCIMALANKTPIIHYFTKRHGKKAWMFRDIGLPEWLYNIDDDSSESVTSALDSIYKDYERAVSKVNRAMSFVESRSKEMISDIKKFVKTA